MAKKKKETKGQESFNINLVGPGFEILERAVVRSIGNSTTEISYRRKGSSYKDIEVFNNENVVAIFATEEEEGSVVVWRKHTPIAKNLKESGYVSESSTGFLKVTRSDDGKEYYVNRNYANLICPDSEANKNVTKKRGRKPASERSESSTSEIKKRGRPPKEKGDKKVKKKKVASDTW